MKQFYVFTAMMAASAMAYAALPQVWPAPGATVSPDTRLTITFPSAPTLGTEGVIRIFDAATHQQVDSLDLSIPAGPTSRTTLPKAPYTLEPYNYLQPRQTNATCTPGTPSGTAARDTSLYQLTIIGGFTDGFHFHPVIIKENQAEIYPHNNLLQYGREYYVTIPASAFTLEKGKFKGITPKDGWRFTTRAQAPDAKQRNLTVARDGSGDFLTLQGALDYIPDFSTEPWHILVKNGDYEEIIYFRNKCNLTIEGESREGAYVHYANNEVFNPHPADVSTNEWLGTFPSRRAAFMADNCRDLTLKNLTIATTLTGQAEGLLINGERTRVENVTIIGSGDALQVNGSTYLEKCSISGHGDTVLGRGPAFFKDCVLTSTHAFAWIRNGSANHGDVFVDCTFIGTTSQAYFARTNGTYPHCEFVLIDCTLEGIPAQGWGGLDRGDNTYVRYWESGSRNPDGTPADTSQRAEGSRVLDPVADKALIDLYRNPEWVLGWRP
ncbi:MAG: pectinesterase family protein [Muribaculaceae bacterium]|nr:pectinesterase family protein [Muribaculaceae bacterium]